MGVLLASTPTSGNTAPLGLAAGLPRLSQPEYLAADPFSAYLLSLTDPAVQAQDALTRSVTAPMAALLAGRTATSPVLTALLASAASAGVAAPASSNASPSPAAASAALPLVQAPAGGSGTEVYAPAEAAPPAEAATPAEAAAASDREAATTSAAHSSQADRTTEAIATANAAAAASLAATAALYASSAAESVSGNSSSLATDATAKYMGAGALGLPATALSAYQAIQNAIPAVSGILGASAMAANTSSNPQGRAFGQATARPAPRGAALPFSEVSGFDLLS